MSISEREHLELYEEREYWEEKASELAYDVAKYFGVDFGEHTNCNCPVQNAIDFIGNKNMNKS